MKKKFRTITVDDIQYTWMVKNDTLTIWKDKKVIKRENVTHCIITPANVADSIKNHIK
jgi:hypothetical protein